jgi:YqjK-like protein
VSERFNQLAARHKTLLAHCAVQRQELGSAAFEIEDQLGRVDRAISLIRNVTRHPAVIAGAIGLIALVGPRRLLSWGSRGLMFYTTGRQLLRAAQDSPRIRRSSSEA